MQNFKATIALLTLAVTFVALPVAVTLSHAGF